MKLKYLPIFILLLSSSTIFSQGSISGSLETNSKFFMRDSIRGADNTPQYDNLLIGTDAWMSLNYNNNAWGLSAGVRLEVYNNSDLHDRLDAFSGVGVGRWFISKKVKNLTITGGYLYDQFGTGITFRAYEERALAIDNSIYGAELKYDFNDNWSAKLFTGQMKNVFSTYKPIIRGLNINGFHKIGEDLTLAPGAAVMNRTMDQGSMDILVSNIESMPVEERFVPKYNVFAVSLYNQLNYKNFSWYFEVSGKSREAVIDRDRKLVNKAGSIIYTSLNYSKKGFGITGQYKRTEYYVLRTSPNEILLDGVINFLPPLARQNTYNLTTRYNAATQDLGEQAFMLDLDAKISKSTSLTLNASNITDLENNLLFREFYGDVTIKHGRDWKLILGGQYINYNQAVYEQKGDSLLTAITPFADFLYRINRKNSIRLEVQYQHNKEDFGSWFFALLEYTIAPKWSFTIWDMYNVVPKKTKDALHYPAVNIAYSRHGNRFTLGYVKQVEGIVCSGGVCRFEPAFSGFKFGVTSTF